MDTADSSPELLTFTEAARRLSVDRSTVYRMVQAEKLTVVTLPIGGRRIPAAAVRALATPAGAA